MYGHGKHIMIVDVYNDTEEQSINGHFDTNDQEVMPSLLSPAPTEDFVTVVRVDEPHPVSSPGYVTVLKVSDGLQDDDVEEVTIYRLPGERLGMALKFEGGVNAADNVSRVFIQSINMDSPAARAESILGPLNEGDEILKIDGREVASMTRMDCVSLLRHAPVCIRMIVRRQVIVEQNGEEEEDITTMPIKKKGPPPPVPPRKTPSLSRAQEQDLETLATVREAVLRLEERTANAERSSIKRPVHPPPLPPRRPKTAMVQDDLESLPKPNFSGVSLSTKLPGWEELLMRRAGKLDDLQCDHLPAKADIYMDVIAEEDEKQVMESESDDTGSSVSTVIERFSRTSTANSSFSEHGHSVDRTTYDLNQVLSPFEQLERELDGEVSADDSQQSTNNETSENITIDPPESFQDSTNLEDSGLLPSCSSISKLSEDNVETANPEDTDMNENLSSELQYQESNIQSQVDGTHSGVQITLSAKDEDSLAITEQSLNVEKIKRSAPPIPPRRTKLEEYSPRSCPKVSKIPRPTYHKPTSSPKSTPPTGSRIPSNPALWKRRRIEVSSTTTSTRTIKSMKKDKVVSVQGVSTRQAYREQSRTIKTGSKETADRKLEYVNVTEVMNQSTSENETVTESNIIATAWHSDWQFQESPAEVSYSNELTASPLQQRQTVVQMCSKEDDETDELLKESVNDVAEENNVTCDDIRLDKEQVSSPRDSDVTQKEITQLINEDETENQLPSHSTSEESDCIEGGRTVDECVEDNFTVATDRCLPKEAEDDIMFDTDRIVAVENCQIDKGEDKMEIASYPDEQFLPPTVYRQPPDGHEFPPNYIEPSIIETRLEDSGVFLEDAVKLPNQQYAIYPAELPDGKPRNNPEEKSLAALDELIHGKCCQITAQDTSLISEDTDKMKKNRENLQDEQSRDCKEIIKPMQSKTEILEDSTMAVEPKSDLKQEDIPKIKDMNICMETPKSNFFKLANEQKPAQLTFNEKKNISQPNVNSRWKSEENLRQDRLTPRSARNNEAQVSVKERIAMFSRSGSEMSLNNSTKLTLNRDDKVSLRSEKKVESLPVQDFILKDCKWHSTGNISSIGGKTDIVSNGTITETSSMTSISAETTTEQSKRTEVTSSYPETQWSRYQRYSYNCSNYPRKLEDCYKRYSTSSLFSSIDKRQSKLKGLVIPEKPSNYSKISKSLPTIVSCSSVLLNKIEVPKVLHANSDTRTEQNNRVSLVDSKEKDTKDINKYTANSLSELPWNQKSSTLPKYSPAFKHRALHLPRTTTPSSMSPTPPSSLTSPLSPPPSSPSSICSSSSSSLQKQDVFHLLADNLGEANGQNNARASNRSQTNNSGRYLAQPVSLSESKTIYESPVLNKENNRTKMEDWSVVTGWAIHGECDDDSMSSASQQTEDSRHLADDSMSETNSDSEFRPRYLSHQRTVLRTTMDSTDSVRNFRALAEKWESRSGDSSDALSPPPAISPVHTLKKESARRNSQDNTKLPPSLKPRSPELPQSTVKLREEKISTPRPQSLIDNPRYAGGLKKLELTESCESLTRLLTNGKEPLQRRSAIGNASRSLSVSDICKSFESSSIQQNGIKSNGHRAASYHTDHERLAIDHNRMSSIDSTSSELSIPEQDNSHSTVILRKQQLTGSVGITLAGGTDCEVKDITIHKVIPGSLADRDGRLRKGDRILMVNSQQVKGLTHREVQSLLKLPCTEVEIVVSQGARDGCDIQRDTKCHNDIITTNNKNNLDPKNKKHITIELIKEGTGLGFGIEGGKDSPLGDRPLLIKRIFKGGAADRDGRLKAGDELLSVNSQSVGNMTRTEAWNYMKKLPDGSVTLTVQVS